MRFKANGGGLDISLRELVLAVALLLGMGNSIGLLNVKDEDRFTATEAALLVDRVGDLELDMKEHDVEIQEAGKILQLIRREHSWMQGREFEGATKEKVE